MTTIKEEDTTSIFITPAQGWEKINDFKAFKINEKLRNMYAQNIILLEILLMNDSSVLYKGEEVIKDIACHTIETQYRNRRFLYFFDKTSGLLIMGKSINSTSEVHYSDYRKVGDFLVPYCHTLMRNGKIINIMNRIEVRFNEKLSIDIFLPQSKK
jgi:hypothetical protein